MYFVPTAGCEPERMREPKSPMSGIGPFVSLVAERITLSVTTNHATPLLSRSVALAGLPQPAANCLQATRQLQFANLTRPIMEVTMTTQHTREGANSIVRGNLTRLNRLPKPFPDGQPCEYLDPIPRAVFYDHDLPRRRLNLIAKQLSQGDKHHRQS